MSRRHAPSTMPSRPPATHVCVNRVRVIPNPASLSSSPPSSPTRARPRPRRPRRRHARARRLDARRHASSRAIARAFDARVCHSHAHYPELHFPLVVPPIAPHARALGRARAAAPIRRGQRRRLRVGARLGRRRWWRRRRRWHAQAIWGVGGGGAAVRHIMVRRARGFRGGGGCADVAPSSASKAPPSRSRGFRGGTGSGEKTHSATNRPLFAPGSPSERARDCPLALQNGHLGAFLHYHATRAPLFVSGDHGNTTQHTPGCYSAPS